MPRAPRGENVTLGWGNGGDSKLTPTIGRVGEEGLTEDTISTKNIIVHLDDIVIMAPTSPGQEQREDCSGLERGMMRQKMSKSIA